MSQKSIASRFTALVLAAATVALTGCATNDPDIAFDPLEPLNRTVYGLNEGIDILALGPVSRIYKEGVPSPFQVIFRNIYRNLEMPVIAFNKLLQGDLSGTGTALGRFMVNTVAGAGGIADIATPAGLPFEDTDFGVTLASWGVKSGPYLVLPLLGPSNFRDATGKVVDWAVDPVRWATKDNDTDMFYYSANALRALDARAGVDAVIEDARKNSLDSYATLRSYFSQHREAEVNKALGRDEPQPAAEPKKKSKGKKKKK